MDLLNQYENLPGQLLVFKDGGSSARLNDVVNPTDSILLLGTAVDGDVMNPVAVDDESVERVFGSDVDAKGNPNGSTLVTAYRQCRDVGCNDIRLMRITGKPATAKLSAPSIREKVKEKIEKNLGIVSGNDETILKLKDVKVKTDSIVVYVRGTKLEENKWSFDQEKKEILIPANKTNAGASVTIEYEYYTEVEKEQDSIVNSDLEIKLEFTPIEGTVVVKDEKGAAIDKSLYTCDSSIIKFTESVTENTFYKVVYKYNVLNYITESGTQKKPFLTATSEQILETHSKPCVDSVILYVGNVMCDKATYSVDYETGQIKLFKENFKMSDAIDINYFVEKEIITTRNVLLSSRNGGDVYNGGLVEIVEIKDTSNKVIGKALRLTSPEKKRRMGERPLIFPSYEYETIGDVLDEINEKHPIFAGYADDMEAPLEDFPVCSSYFIGGNDECKVSKERLFEALSGKRDNNGFLLEYGAYQILEGYCVDCIVPVGVYADDELPGRNQNFAYELALACAIYSHKGRTTLGAIATKPLKDTSLLGIMNHSKYLASLDNNFLLKNAKGELVLDEEGEPMDIGKFITVATGPETVHEHKCRALRFSNPAVVYAALNSNLPANSAPTNKQIKNCLGLRYSFKEDQLNIICGNRLAPFGTKYSPTTKSLSGAFCIDGPTSARKGSKYGRTLTWRSIKVVADDIIEVGDPYIGEAPTVENQNSLSSAISKRLDKRLEQGIILDYGFNIVSTQRDRSLGESKVEYELLTPQETRRITSIIGLKRG